MYGSIKQHLVNELEAIRSAGLYKQEREISSPQGSHIRVGEGRQLLNLCANNYLGLAQHPGIQDAAQRGLEEWGYGLASVRFICGTQSIHRALEQKLSDFLGMEDTLLYSSCFDANGGLFETLLDEKDAVISDQLNHASIIDGIRLCKAQRYRYRNNDMEDLEAQLKTADRKGARFKLITTDGVFSMDGYIARLDEICELARQYDALVHCDDAHATGVIGEQGRGTHEFRHCMEQVDIITGTLGKALGGASGGFTSARREIITLLRQRSRPYLFSNSLAPAMVAGAVRALELVADPQLRDQLQQNSDYFRTELQQLGFELLPGQHPIVPVMIHDAGKAAEFANLMHEQGIYVTAFSYPVVPEGQARIRTQMSAAFSRDDLDFALDGFNKIKRQLKL